MLCLPKQKIHVSTGMNEQLSQKHSNAGSLLNKSTYLTILIDLLIFINHSKRYMSVLIYLFMDLQSIGICYFLVLK